MFHQIVFLSLLLSISHAPLPFENIALKPDMLSAVPQRPKNAVTGSQFAELAANMTGRSLQESALKELRKGNMPAFLRTLQPVIITYQPEKSAPPVTIIIRVTPDYLAIGSDDDFLRIPLSYPFAAAVASEFGCILPTRKMVDAIYQRSSFHYTPAPLPPCPMMRTIPYFLKHQDMIESQWRARQPEKLVSGHKKDVVITNRLREKPGRVAIYGWHMQDGKPIQGLSTFHGAHYADYSHGIRLVDETALVNGVPCTIYDILEDPDLAPALTYEGRIPNARELMVQNPQAFQLAESHMD